MKKLLLVATFFASVIASYSQEEAFALQNQADQRIGVNETFILPIRIEPFPDANPISGLVISGDVILNSDSSLVRVILIDDNYNEYLVFESYTLLTDSWSFSIDQIGEETTLLNNIIPSMISIDVIDASFYFKELITSNAGAFLKAARSNLQIEQSNIKIIKINQNLKNRNIPWIAGETSISQLTYEEKKAYFGGNLPNLSGFEYYVGGIFVLPGSLETNENRDYIGGTEGLEDSPYVKEFSWRDVHGQDWVTPVKNQGGCGSCWAFAATGATELLVNLYYNQHLDLNLAEQEVLSCSEIGACNGGWANVALNLIRDKGIVNEECFPYVASDVPCSNICQDPYDIVGIGGYEGIGTKSTEKLKRMVLNGAMTIGIIPWWHIITLVGYKTLDAGDRVYIRTSGQSSWVVIDNNSPLIGKTAWLIKNSYGTGWGSAGYAYVVLDIAEIYHTNLLKGPITSTQINTNDIICSDYDGDGYYTWGIGPKPAHCPPCPDEPDGDDSNGCIGPRDAYGNLQSFTTPEPTTEDVTIFEGQPVPNLNAIGSNIKWYSDYDLNNIVQTGNSFATGQTSQGIYTYYVTQTLSDCESVPETVHLTILEGITPPVAENVDVCFGDQQLIKASGESIRWYSDAGVNVLVYEGNNYSPPVTEPAVYIFYITQTIEGIESPASQVTYTIKQPPGPINAEDKVFCSDEGLFMYAYGDNINWYTGEFSNELFDERNNRTYKIVSIGKQVWMAENLDIGIQIDGDVESMDNGILEKYYYNDDQAIGSNYGGLYQWEELMNYSNEEGSQGICPAGWHIPSNDDWNELELELGMSPDEVDALGLRGTDQGLQLREGGSSGFEALMAGKRESEGIFSALEYYATFWNSSEYNRTLSVHFDQVFAARSWSDTITNGFSVRCIKDESSYVVHGNRLDVTDYKTGEYSFRVTNTYEGCESMPDTVSLIIHDTPNPPTVGDYEYCLNEEAPILEAIGKNIKWYHDMTKTVFTDDRDDRAYKMVQIGHQVWMAENLGYGTQIIGSQESTRNGIVEKYYYNDDPAYGSKYGGLYQWQELMDYTSLENTQGICPAGWEVPSNRDWMQLEMYLGMNQAEATLYTSRGTDQGAQLKDGGESGFDAIMGGKRTPEGNYVAEGDYTSFWNSSAYNRTLGILSDQVFASKAKYDPITNAFSLRCLMNDSSFTTIGNQMVSKFTESGIYKYAVTQTLDGCESESAIINLTLREKPIPPQSQIITLCAGDAIPELDVDGENIRWYADLGLNTLVHSGNLYTPENLSLGLNTYYVTQSDSYCESEPSIISIELKPTPNKPEVTEVTACFGELIPDLSTAGEMVKWYDDENLQGLLHTGNDFETGNSNVGIYRYFVTQTINGCESLSSRISLTINELPFAPTASDVSVCEGEEIPVIVAIGDSIRWYSDAEHEYLIQLDSTLLVELLNPGIFTYYATQTRNGCEGPAEHVEVRIRELPSAPDAPDVQICEGDKIPVLIATGDSIKWYDRSTLENIIHRGSKLDVLPVIPGSYLYYVTQTQEGCEGIAEEIELIINEMPIISLGNDTVIQDDQDLILGPFPVEYSYLWNNTTKEPYLSIIGKDMDPGDHIISVQVTYNGCVFKDTISITVESTIGIDQLNSSRSIKVFPNPTEDYIIVDFIEEIGEDVIIEVIDSRGALIQKFEAKEFQMDGGHSMKIYFEIPGLYYLRIYIEDQTLNYKVIRQ